MRKKENKSFLNLVTGDAGNWREETIRQDENRHNLKRSAYVAVQLIKELKLRNWTQAFLAEKLGVTPQYISKVLKGHENLSFDTVASFEDALNIKIKLDVPDFSVEVKETNDALKIAIFRFSQKSKESVKKEICLMIDSYSEFKPAEHEEAYSY